MTKRIYKIDPLPKPRMTRGSVHSVAAKRYWQYKNDVRYLKIKVPECNSHIIFVLRMPNSWSKKKKEMMDGRPHQQRPDVDNLQKALMDSIFDEDSHIWDIHTTKKWGYTGSIIIKDHI